MRILVVGGTRFVGRHLVADARARGHRVSVLHRGVDCSGAPGAEHLHADRDGDLRVLAGREWDATVDVSAYWPGQVAHLADALGERGGRHLLVSTVSVYADPPQPGLDEQAPLLAPLGLDGDRPSISPVTYGALKVGCEQVAWHRHAGGLVVVRPTIVVGPHDYTGRFPYWVARMARGGEVLAPGDPDAPMQWIDGRDLARLMVELLESGESGTVHAMAPGPPWSLGGVLEQVRDAVAPPGTTLRWVASDLLVERGISPAQLPLWTGSDSPEFALAMDPHRALDAGLRARSLLETARDTWAWLRDPTAGSLRREGWLAPAREAELLSGWASR